MPLRVPAAFSAVEEAAEATEEAVVEAEEAEPPQAVRAAAAATVPQTARNERRVIFFHNIFLQIGPGTRPAAIYVVFVFFLGTALLYSSGSISSTMAGQNAGKSFGGRAGPLQRACKLAVKTVAPFFTLPEKLPKTILLPLGRTKKPRALFPECPGQKVFISSWV